MSTLKGPLLINQANIDSTSCAYVYEFHIYIYIYIPTPTPPKDPFFVNPTALKLFLHKNQVRGICVVTAVQAVNTKRLNPQPSTLIPKPYITLK